MAYLLNAQLVGNLRKLQWETHVTDFEYADDMALLADSWDALEVVLTSLSTHCQDFGLSISCAKTETMAALPSSSFPPPEQRRSGSIPSCASFVPLFSPHCCMVQRVSCC